MMLIISIEENMDGLVVGITCKAARPGHPRPLPAFAQEIPNVDT
jgi:hypothetical protein